MTDPHALADRLEEMAAASTPGPWGASDFALSAHGISLATFHASSFHGNGLPQPQEANAALIVELRNALPEILAALRGQGWQPINTCEMPEVAAMRYIETLRAEPGNSVTILCDNEDANYKSEQLAVEIVAEWTSWEPRRFYGESVLQCLAKAVVALLPPPEPKP